MASPAATKLWLTTGFRTGRRPVDPKEWEALRIQIVNEDPPWLAEIAPGVPDACHFCRCGDSGLMIYSSTLG
jgi:hypothetical protein